MYSVTKRIDFCYGHRLLDYDGICKHPHGHNAIAEIEVRTDQLDNRNMVCDFSDIKRIVKGWIDRELDHRMVLRHDDPLVAPLKALGEPMYLVDSNPTVERIARLIFDYAASQQLPVVRVKVWETPTSFAEYDKPRVNVRLVAFDLDGTLVDSLQDLAESVNELLIECGGQPHAQDVVGRMVGDGASTLVARAFQAANVVQAPDALARFLRIYNARPVRFTRPYPGVPETLDALLPRVTLAVLTNKPLGATRQILEALDLARYFDADRVVGGDGPFPRKPDTGGLLHLAAQAGVAASETVLVGDSVNDWRTARAAGARACLARYGFGFDGFPVAELDARDLVIDSPAELLSRL